MNWGAAYYPFQILIGELPGNVVHKALRFAPNPSFTKQHGHMSQTTRSHVTNNPVTCHKQHGHMSQTIRSPSHPIAPNQGTTCQALRPEPLLIRSHANSFIPFFHSYNIQSERNSPQYSSWGIGAELSSGLLSIQILIRSVTRHWCVQVTPHRKPIANPSQTHRKPIAHHCTQHSSIHSLISTHMQLIPYLFLFLHHSIWEKFITIFILRNRWCTEMRPIIHFKY
jgi:hypothetical protein